MKVYLEVYIGDWAKPAAVKLRRWGYVVKVRKSHLRVEADVVTTYDAALVDITRALLNVSASFIYIASGKVYPELEKSEL